MRAPLPIVAVLALTSLPLVSCPGRRTYQEELATTPSGAQHAVHTERLLGVMRGLDRLDQERLPKDVDLEAAREPRLAELVQVAEAIAASAERIPQAAWSEGGLTGPERVAFHQHAALLRERALTLARGARGMTPEQRDQAVSALRQACEGCHTEFRASLPRDLEDRRPDGS